VARRRSIVQRARAEKEDNFRKLRQEKDARKLEKIIQDLGDAADESTIKPLLQLVDDSGRADGPRIYAIDAILRTASNPDRTPGTTSILHSEAKPHIKRLLDSPSKRLRRTAAQFLYRTGAKDEAGPVLSEALKDGEWGFLSTFVYHRHDGDVQVLGAMPGEKQQIDAEAKPLIEKASGRGFPDEVRYRSSLMLAELGNNESALNSLEDLILNSTDRSVRTRALSSVADIGGSKAQEILAKAANIAELRSFARRMLMRKK